MTVALSDTKLLCDMLQPLPDFTDSIATANQTAAFYTKRKPLSATINTLANALYKVRHIRLGYTVAFQSRLCTRPQRHLQTAKQHQTAAFYTKRKSFVCHHQHTCKRLVQDALHHNLQKCTMQTMFDSRMKALQHKQAAALNA